MREAILQTAAHPAIAVLFLTLGWAGIVAEFLFPGKMLPGVLGCTLTLLALRSLLPLHTGLAIATVVPLTLISLGLLRFTLRVRKHKRIDSSSERR